MPTFYEVEEIKQAQTQALLQAKARAEANLGGVSENKDGGANILISPFGATEKEQAMRGGDATASSRHQNTESVATRSVDSDPGFDLAFSGTVFLVGCVLLYLMLRRIWD
jgi:hypothetical protein